MQTMRTGLLAAVLITGLTFTACGHPSDASMEKRFAIHENAFEQLLEMSKADSQITRIPAEAQDHGAVPSEKVLTEQRRQAYRSLFQTTGLNGGIDRSPLYPAATFFIAGYSGIGIKGYVYSEVPLSPLVASLDGKLHQKSGPRSTDYLHSNTSKRIGISTTMSDPVAVNRRSVKVRELTFRRFPHPCSQAKAS